MAVVASIAAIALAATAFLVLGNDDANSGSSANDDTATAGKPALTGGNDGDDASTSGGTGGDTGGPSGGAQEPPGKLVKPANSTGVDGTTVIIGPSDASATLDVYEDLRCPPCAHFEQNVGETIIKDVKAGKYKASFHMATFLDGSMGGNGSKNALSALGAALDVSPEAFLHYKKALYAQGNHPEEGTDAFAQDSHLLKVADQVPELKTNTKFQAHVRAGTFDAWALKMSAAFTASAVQSTPTVELNGQKLTANGMGAPMTAEEFTAAVDGRI